MRITVVTGGTSGRQALAELAFEVQVLAPGRKRCSLIRNLRAESVVAISSEPGNAAVLAAAAIDIAVMKPGGSPVELLGVADVVVSDVREALELIADPPQLGATLGAG